MESTVSPQLKKKLLDSITPYGFTGIAVQTCKGFWLMIKELRCHALLFEVANIQLSSYSKVFFVDSEKVCTFAN